MTGRTAAGVNRAKRAARLLWPDRNPLRRAVDRVEAAIVTALIVVFLIGAPLAVAVTSHVAYRNGIRTAYAERTAWHQVRAILLDKVFSAGPTGPPQAPAWWTAPDGSRRTGLVSATPGARAGSAVMVWTDSSGRLTGRPLTLAQVRGQAALLAALAPVVLGLVLLGTGTLAHRLFARRRLAAWDADWRATGPQWTRQG